MPWFLMVSSSPRPEYNNWHFDTRPPRLLLPITIQSFASTVKLIYCNISLNQSIHITQNTTLSNRLACALIHQTMHLITLNIITIHHDHYKMSTKRFLLGSNTSNFQLALIITECRAWLTGSLPHIHPSFPLPSSDPPHTPSTILRSVH